jgi:hypothetical protein
MSITPSIVIVCIDIQGEEHHPRPQKPLKVLANLKNL